MTPTMSNPAALNPDALRAAMIAGEAECREYGFRGPHDGIYEVAIRAYLSALPAPSAVAGDGLVERLLSDDPFGDPFSSEKNAKEAASRITELQAKVARMEVEAFDAATAHGKTKLALAKSEASAAIWEMDTWIAEAESYLSALAAPSAVAGDGLVERLQRPWDGSSGSRDRRDAERREAATLITELQAKVARMEVEAFDAATAHGKTKLALAKSEASREAAEARVEGLVEDLIAELEERITLHGDDMGDTIAGRIAQLRAARTWTECGR